MQPLKLRTRHMPTKVTKPPKKGKGAKYNRQQQKKVTESPDFVDTISPRLSWHDSDALPFGYYNGEFYIASETMTHYELGDMEIKDTGGAKDWRVAMKYPGRVWERHKLFSLWQYPKTLSDWQKLVRDLSSALHTDVKKFKVEMAKTFGKNNDDWDDSSARVIVVGKLLDKLAGKKKVKIPQHDKDTQNLKHLKSPLVKGQEFVPAGLGSKKWVAGMPYSKYHQMRMTSDGVISIKTLVENILKVRRVQLLVEQLLREDTVVGWPSYFAVGPDGKQWPAGYGQKLRYHGDIVKKYPTVKKVAQRYYTTDDALEGAIEDGRATLYTIMYTAGIIRAGKTWVAFDPKHVTSKALMTILAAAKKGGVKKFDVETVSGENHKFHEDMSVEEFIEKFL